MMSINYLSIDFIIMGKKSNLWLLLNLKTRQQKANIVIEKSKNFEDDKSITTSDSIIKNNLSTLSIGI